MDELGFQFGKNKQSLELIAWRIQKVEENGLVNLIDTEDENNLLVDMLGVISTASQDPLFCNPPLKYASRFGTQSELSIWYGSLQIETALVEKAFYLFNFLRSSNITTNKLLFESFTKNIKTENGVDLTKEPFANYRSSISSPTHYNFSQQIGKMLRKNDVDAFCYYSARSHFDAVNIGVFSPKIFEKNYQKQLHVWRCIISDTKVEFTALSDYQKRKFNFRIDQFLIDDKIMDNSPSADHRLQ